MKILSLLKLERMIEVKWEEVRTIYPNQFVKLQILDYHMADNMKIIDDMAVIKAFKDNKEATKELVRSTGDIIVYHTSNENIEIEIKNIRSYRGIV